MKFFNKKKNIYLAVVLFAVFGLMGFILYNNITYSTTDTYDSLKLDISKAQKKYYKYGTFTTKGLTINAIRDNKVVDKAVPNVEVYPDLNKTGMQKVTVTYNNQKFSYNVAVLGNKPGNIITLKDGSKWYYLKDEGNNVILLSVNYLMEKCDDSQECRLTFFERNGINSDNSYDNIYKTKFNELAENCDNDYENSSIKQLLDNNFTSYFLGNLSNYVDGDISDKINISLPSADIISEIGKVNNWTQNATGDSSSFSLDKKTALFLSDDGQTYWTSTKHTDTTRFAWEVNSNESLFYANSSTFNFAIRPMMTISSDLLGSIVKKSDENSDGELDLVTAPNYIIYDVKNGTVLREHKTYNSSGSEDTIFPASMTKVSTAIYTIDEMKRRGISLDDTVTVHQCVDLLTAANPKMSVAGFKSGDVVTYKDLLYGALYPSGGDATMQLALSFLKSDEPLPSGDGMVYADCSQLNRTFSTQMTEYVKSNILKDENAKTNYVNAGGFVKLDHITTLYETAKIFEYAIKNETFRNIVSGTSYTAEVNRDNSIVPLDLKSPFSSTLNHLDYFVGGKTGHAGVELNGDYYDSGYNAVAYYESDNSAYIVVTATDSVITDRVRSQHLIYQWLFPGENSTKYDYLNVNDNDTPIDDNNSKTDDDNNETTENGNSIVDSGTKNIDVDENIDHNPKTMDIYVKYAFIVLIICLLAFGLYYFKYRNNDDNNNKK